MNQHCVVWNGTAHGACELQIGVCTVGPVTVDVNSVDGGESGFWIGREHGGRVHGPQIGFP